nr:GNAT family N-acetyltransferase [uncultured Rhodoferax sp.]
MQQLKVELRAMRDIDCPAVAALLPDLGYSATPAQMQARLTALREWPHQEAFVAEVGGVIAGLCQIQGVRLLASDGYAEVQALVVATGHQQRGIGKALLQRGCDWACELGYGRVRLRSGLHREGAHQFYEAAGFTRSSASYGFELHLPSNTT